VEGGLPPPEPARKGRGGWVGKTALSWVPRPQSDGGFWVGKEGPSCREKLFTFEKGEKNNRVRGKKSKKGFVAKTWGGGPLPRGEVGRCPKSNEGKREKANELGGEGKVEGTERVETHRDILSRTEKRKSLIVR